MPKGSAALILGVDVVGESVLAVNVGVYMGSH